MTFSLYIMRHAKSDWSSNASDFDRPINERGQKNAARIGRWLNEHGVLPEMVICSSAMRAKQTWELVQQQLKDFDSVDVALTRELYLADEETLLNKIELYQHGVKSLFLIAHNPGLDYLVSYLSNNQFKRDKNGKLMTTAALAIFEYENSEISKPTQMELVRPKELT